MTLCHLMCVNKYYNGLVSLYKDGMLPFPLVFIGVLFYNRTCRYYHVSVHPGSISAQEVSYLQYISGLWKKYIYSLSTKNYFQISITESMKELSLLYFYLLYIILSRKASVFEYILSKKHHWNIN
jgi:hypothetical protein